VPASKNSFFPEIAMLRTQECNIHILPMSEEEVDYHKVAVRLEKFCPLDDVRSMWHRD
jgi:hypothetical protein